MPGFNIMGFTGLGAIYHAKMWKVLFYSSYLNGLNSCENYFMTSVHSFFEKKYFFYIFVVQIILSRKTFFEKF